MWDRGGRRLGVFTRLARGRGGRQTRAVGYWSILLGVRSTITGPGFLEMQSKAEPAMMMTIKPTGMVVLMLAGWWGCLPRAFWRNSVQLSEGRVGYTNSSACNVSVRRLLRVGSWSKVERQEDMLGGIRFGRRSNGPLAKAQVTSGGALSLAEG